MANQMITMNKIRKLLKLCLEAKSMHELSKCSFQFKHLEFYLTFPKFEYLYFKYPTFSKPETVSN
jgi:hypothetical protein